MNLQKINNFYIGFLTGLAFPLFLYSFYWLFFQQNIELDETDLHYFTNRELSLNIFKMCCGGNLILFYLGLNRKLTPFTKGIIGSVVVYALIIAYFTFVGP